MDEHIGVIKMFVGNFVPQDYLWCSGQTLEIAYYTSLYSIIGTTYGGDGRTTFKLPDLRGRMPIGAGQGPGLSTYSLGAMGGNETSQLELDQLPTHNHAATFYPTKDGNSGPLTATVSVIASIGGIVTNDPAGAYWAQAPNAGAFPVKPYSTALGTAVEMASDAVQVTLSGGITEGTVNVANEGLGQAFSNMSPYVTCNFIICINGTYPPRN
ncbi:MAG: tail fiber protein [Marinoscillum sp.]|uniref:phage tail protein n=1 Tax=Marinoscillum sp. TaxID=2024838 RepID=UPI00330111C4